MVEKGGGVGRQEPTQPQYTEGQMGHEGLWQDQKPLVVGDVAEPATLPGGRPPDPAVPIAALERGGSKTQKGHSSGAGEGDIFEGLPDQTAIPH